MATHSKITSFFQLVVGKSTAFVQYLEPLLPTKRKEEIARCLVNIHEKAPESNITAFLAPLVDHELDTSGEFFPYELLDFIFPCLFFVSKLVKQ